MQEWEIGIFIRIRRKIMERTIKTQNVESLDPFCKRINFP